MRGSAIQLHHQREKASSSACYTLTFIDIFSLFIDTAVPMLLTDILCCMCVFCVTVISSLHFDNDCNKETTYLITCPKTNSY